MKRLLGALIAVVVAALAAWAGSRHGLVVLGVPVLAWQILVVFVIQWIGFAHSRAARTDRFFDLTGSLTYILVTILGLALAATADGARADARTWVLAILVIVWAARLGSFLFRRVLRSGGDGRFDDILPDAPRLFTVWTVQGLWVSLTALAAWIAISSRVHVPFGAVSVIGVLVWAAGIGLEAVADRQKSRFRADAANTGEFITTGLWSRSRHPNYAGEILLWVGVLIVAAPALRGWQWAALVSPLFVALLLTRISGIPLLEKRADDRWGDREDYQRYKATTPVLVPRLTAPRPSRR